MATPTDRSLHELIAELAQARQRVQATCVEMEYDWARIDFLLSTLDAAHPVVLTDLQAFDTFLRDVRDRSAAG